MNEGNSRGDEGRIRVALNASGAGDLRLRWYEIDQSRSLEEDEAVSGKIALMCPEKGQWAAVLSLDEGE